MCGIAGIISKTANLQREQAYSLLSRMNENISHRGPDGEGILIDGRAGFAHRRLAIIDLDKRSDQPMSTTDNKLHVVFNGEIYNFRELRQQLEGLGHHFTTSSDTEVLLHGYRQWGKNLPIHLRGMFAFAIWDAREQVAFLARDRFGKKPLYYFEDDKCILFGSEIKSLLEYPELSRKINHSSIHDYMTYGYCVGSETAFEGVFRLPPAHSMSIRANHGISLDRYWSLPARDDELEIGISEASEQLLELFDDAIRARMVSDVPLGAFLSGGVDSSAVVARMSEYASGSIKTFSVGFPISGFDETEYARTVAKKYETDHHSFMMDYDIIEELPKIVWHYGEPFADSSSLVMYALSREIEKHVKVALSGDGGDEIFIGYSRYTRFQETVDELKLTGFSNAQKYTIGPYQDPPQLRDVYARSISSFRDEHKMRGYGPALAPYLFAPSNDRLGTLLDRATPHCGMETAARVDTAHYLPYDLLVKSDIATMAHGLECRSPFLDHTLAEWASRLPQGTRIFKRRGQLETKALLKKAMEPHLPHDIIYRPKQGFSVPVKHWMKNEIKDFLIDTLTSKRHVDREITNPKYVNFMLDHHMSDKEDHGTRLWNLLCFELWAQTFIDKTDTSPLNISVKGAASSSYVS